MKIKISSLFFYFLSGKQMIRLNLGCGNNVRKGWENYDKNPRDKTVQPLDLEKLPLPFGNEYADEILLNYVFEHLFVNKYSLLCELSRILKKGGVLTINVPVSYHVVEHENILFTWEYFNNLCTNFYGNLFVSTKYKTTNNTFRKKIWKIKQLLFWLFKDKISYELRK